MSKVYKAVHVLNRGRESEILPGTLFVPSAKDRDDFLSLGAITEASEQEAALYEKTHKGQPAAADADAPKRGRGKAKADESDSDDSASDNADGTGDLVG